ncbi:hypothetical protein BSL78_08974 [Apostichopus japonicus]|uniref:Uncharacterized protein n=1 Tax=Stichopus japonicus TaxID=307972 RepID=A0A2G8L1J9_STIJA|nr:hypothetical protein BSL78_08974 [Apostichopus japonicus]
MWRPKQHALYQLNETNCIIWVESFSWETCRIDDKDVLYKRIQVYAACSKGLISKNMQMELGYYIDLPGQRQIIEKNNLRVLQEKPFSFWKDGRLPLKISLEKIRPESWKCSEGTNSKDDLNSKDKKPCAFVEVKGHLGSPGSKSEYTIHNTYIGNSYPSGQVTYAFSGAICAQLTRKTTTNYTVASQGKPV